VEGTDIAAGEQQREGKRRKQQRRDQLIMKRSIDCNKPIAATTNPTTSKESAKDDQNRTAEKHKTKQNKTKQNKTSKNSTTTTEMATQKSETHGCLSKLHRDVEESTDTLSVIKRRKVIGKQQNEHHAVQIDRDKTNHGIV
jgi:hypothetical protein